MSENEVLGNDSYIPDFDLDGTQVSEDDLADKDGGVTIKGIYHLELMHRDMVAIEGKARNLNMRFSVVGGEHESEFGKTVFHRMYLEKNEYEMVDGSPVMETVKRNDGSTYEAKKKTGKILPLVAGDKVIGGHGRFCVGLGLLTHDQIAGKKFSLPLSLINPGIQCFAMVTAKGEIDWNKTWELDDDEMVNIPRNEAAAIQAAAGAAGVNNDAIDAI